MKLIHLKGYKAKFHYTLFHWFLQDFNVPNTENNLSQGKKSEVIVAQEGKSHDDKELKLLLLENVADQKFKDFEKIYKTLAS